MVAAIDRPGGSLKDLPRSTSASTAFQQRVWNVLRQFLAGEKPGPTPRSAEAARRPEGVVRAAGMACGSNPVSIVIPCHRVVGSNKKLTGYRWGVERKRDRC